MKHICLQEVFFNSYYVFLYLFKNYFSHKEFCLLFLYYIRQLVWAGFGGNCFGFLEFFWWGQLFGIFVVIFVWEICLVGWFWLVFFIEFFLCVGGFYFVGFFFQLLSRKFICFTADFFFTCSYTSEYI